MFLCVCASLSLCVCVCARVCVCDVSVVVGEFTCAFHFCTVTHRAMQESISRESKRVNPSSKDRGYDIDGIETECFIDQNRTVDVPLPKAKTPRKVPPTDRGRERSRKVEGERGNACFLSGCLCFVLHVRALKAASILNQSILLHANFLRARVCACACVFRLQTGRRHRCCSRQRLSEQSCETLTRSCEQLLRVCVCVCVCVCV